MAQSIRFTSIALLTLGLSAQVSADPQHGQNRAYWSGLVPAYHTIMDRQRRDEQIHPTSHVESRQHADRGAQHHRGHLSPTSFKISYQSDYQRYLSDYFTFNNSYSRSIDTVGHHHTQWANLGRLRTRSSSQSNPVIPVNRELKAISLHSAKRSAIVTAAYAELSNGRVIRLPGLEGYLQHGHQASTRLDEPRRISKLILWIKPTGDRRAYIDVNLRPASDKARHRG